MPAFDQINKDMRILVVDDFPSTRQIIKRALKALGFMHVFEAKDGDDALRKLHNEPCHLVISDWNMPNMSGLEFFNAIRSDKELNHLPFLMITAEAERESILTAAQAGVTHYMIKPFSAEILQHQLEAIFKQVQGPNQVGS